MQKKQPGAFHEAAVGGPDAVTFEFVMAFITRKNVMQWLIQ